MHNVAKAAAESAGMAVAHGVEGDIPIQKAFIMQTDPTIDPVADPANQPLDEPGEQPRPLPGTPPETDPLTPGVAPENEKPLRRS
jgi:hypothetical protein